MDTDLLEQFLRDNEGTVLFSGMIAALLTAAILEIFYPRRKEPANNNARWSNNIGLTLINEASVYALTVFVTVAIAWWGDEEQIGLLRSVEIGFLPTLLLAILAFEFISYWFHRALHAFPWLWRLHAVHHSDTELDFTTTYRNHPVELYVNAPLTIPLILLLGFPVPVVVAYQLIKTSISVFAHSNVRIPRLVDNILRKVIVTPDYHHLHHSSDRQFTDSNFGASFSVYDHLFGTATRKPYEEHETMELGLTYFRDPADSRLDRLLLMPFVWRARENQPENSGQPELS